MVFVAAIGANVNAPYPGHHYSYSPDFCNRKTWARVRRTLFTLADSIPPQGQGYRRKDRRPGRYPGRPGCLPPSALHYAVRSNSLFATPRDDAVIFLAVVARATARNHSVLMTSVPPRDRLHLWVSRQTRASLTKETLKIACGTSTREASLVLALGAVEPLFIPVQKAPCRPQGQALRPHPPGLTALPPRQTHRMPSNRPQDASTMFLVKGLKTGLVRKGKKASH